MNSFRKLMGASLVVMFLVCLLAQGSPVTAQEDTVLPSDEEAVEGDSQDATLTDKESDLSIIKGEALGDQTTADTGTTATTGATAATGTGGADFGQGIVDFVTNFVKIFQNFFQMILQLLFGTNTATTGTDTTGATNTTGDGTTTTTGAAGANAAGTAAENIRASYGITLVNSGAVSSGDGLEIGAGTFSDQEVSQVADALGKLPKSFSSCTTRIIKTGSLADQGTNCYGLFDPANGNLYVDQTATTDGEFEGTVVHEMTHAFQNTNPNVEQAWTSQFWNGDSPKTSSVSDYGNTNAAEDMAESVRVYFLTGASLKASDPARYNFVKDNIMGGKEF